VYGGQYGIYLGNPGGGSIQDNTVTNNNWGISIWYFGPGYPQMTITGNTISANAAQGLRIENAHWNNVYNNYFNNSVNALPISSNNTWNTSLNCVGPTANIVGSACMGGNFWALPNGTGVSQLCDDVNEDGICDENYTIASANIDFYPLRDPGLPYPGCVSDNYTFTCGDTINESCTLNTDLTHNETCFTVGVDNLVLDGAGYSLTGNISYGVKGISANGRFNLTVRNFNLFNYDTGINFRYTNDSIITNNTLINSSMGIDLWHSNFNSISVNTVSGGGFGGIRVYAASNNQISNNSFTNNTQGVEVNPSSDNNTFTGNNITNSIEIGIAFSANSNNNTLTNNYICSNGFDVNDSDSNTGSGNTCDTPIGFNDTQYIGCTNFCNGSSGILDPAGQGCVGDNFVFQCGDTINESCTLNTDLAVNGTCFSIFTDNIVVDGGGYTITGNGSVNTYGIVLGTTLNNVTVQNFHVTNSYYGIISYGGSGLTIQNNNASNNTYYGIYYRDGNNTIIRNNTVDSNGQYGIFIYSNSRVATNNTLEYNTVRNNPYAGIMFGNSGSYNTTGNTASYNTACDNGVLGGKKDINTTSNNTGDYNTCDEAGWNDDGITGCSYSCGCGCDACEECTYKLNGSECNTVNVTANINHSGSRCINAPINFEDKTFDCKSYTITGVGNQHGIYQNSNNGTTVKNCILVNWSTAFYATNSNTNTFENNTALACNQGIVVYNTLRSVLTDNTVQDCGSRCYYLNNGNDANSSHTVTNNTAFNCSNGFRLWRTHNNTITGNTAENCTQDGFHLFHSGSNLFNENIARNNTLDGFYLGTSSDNNTLTGNVVRQNRYGLNLTESANNSILSNTICNNTLADISTDGTLNTGNTNRCDNTTNWNDQGATGCRYICSTTDQEIYCFTGWNLISLYLTP